MIQKLSLHEDISIIKPQVPRSSTIHFKVNVKEKKVAKRKEKSRVAAQIRRNKESQTLILLQNALPLALPNPTQILEKSIVIRIAGQTLFLMNTLDQVLGMNGNLTVPMQSNNFLTFFMDSMDQIVYTSPNVQALLEQYHWSNLIGMSIFDVVDLKSRWPTPGEAVRLKLSNNPIITSEAPSFLTSVPLAYQPQSCNARPTIPSRLNINRNLHTCSSSSINSTLYNVWCCTNIHHTDSKLRLLILQSVKIKSSSFNNMNPRNEISKNAILSKTNILSPQRSTSWPSYNPARHEYSVSSQYVQNSPGNYDHIENELTCFYQRMITSTHDRYYHFKSASTEFCELIGEFPNSITELNLLDIIHLEDVVKMKTFFDLVVENNDSHIWTPIYRIICRNGQQCLLKTLVKQYCSTTPNSLILNHILIKNRHANEDFISKSLCERHKIHRPHDSLVSMSSVINDFSKRPRNELYIIRSDSKRGIIRKRKSDDFPYLARSIKVPKLINRTVSSPVLTSNNCINKNVSVRPSSVSGIIETKSEYQSNNEILNNDPFVPMGQEKYIAHDKKNRQDIPLLVDVIKLSLINRPIFNNQHLQHFNRSPSPSLESYVLTSPGSETTDIILEDQFVWDVNSSFQDITQLNTWLDDQYQKDLELILPI